MLQNRKFGFTLFVVLLLVLIAAVVLPFAGIWSGKSGPYVKDGILDLRDWDLDEDGNVRLNGEWSLYGGQLLEKTATLGTDEAKPDRLAEVPGEWMRYEIPGRGYATYRLKVLTSGDAGSLGLHIPAIAPAYKVIVDGQTIAEAGTVGIDRSDTRSAYRPQTVVFQPREAEFELLVQIANELYPAGGIWYSLTLGTEQSMLNMKMRNTIVDMAAFGGCALLGLYQIAVFLLRRADRTTLYFGICCLLGAIRLWVVGGIYWMDMFPAADIRTIITIEYLTYYGGVTMAALFVNSSARLSNRLSASVLVLSVRSCFFRSKRIRA